MTIEDPFMSTKDEDPSNVAETPHPTPVLCEDDAEAKRPIHGLSLAGTLASVFLEADPIVG